MGGSILRVCGYSKWHRKIYIPFLNEAVDPNNTQQIEINVNTASQTELELLPKVGPVTAQKIIAHRPYADADELVSKQAVGQKTLDTIKDIISFWHDARGLAGCPLL